MSFNLERALEDLAEAGAARRPADDDTLTARVGTIATRIRRRRALRYTGTTVVAACAVGALAVGVAMVPGLLDRGPTPPATSPSTEPSPTADATLPPFDLAGACGQALSALAPSLEAYVQPETSSVPETADAGFAEVRGVTADGAGVELEFFGPNGARVLELWWSVLLVDADGVVVATAQTGPGATDALPGTTSTVTTTALPTSACADGGPLTGEFDVVGVAEAHGTRASGPAFSQRTASAPFPVELGAIDAGTDDPVADVFACGEPGPESIHTLPDAAGLTFAVDLPPGPWTAQDVPSIPGFLGATDGRSIIANVPLGVAGALVDPAGTVAGFVLPDATDVQLVELTPGSTSEIALSQSLVMCTPDGLIAPVDELEGTFTLWPYVTASLKEVTDADGNATSSSDTVVAIANPQEVTFTP